MNSQSQIHKEQADGGCLELEEGKKWETATCWMWVPFEGNKNILEPDTDAGVFSGSLTDLSPLTPHHHHFPGCSSYLLPTSIFSAFLSSLSPWICSQP